MAFTPPAGATQNEYGYWILPNGDFAPGQDMSGQMAGATPAQRAAVPGPVQTDVNGKPYQMISGQKWYVPPAQPDPARGGSGLQGGGLIHGRAQWNPQTGEYDTPFDWGKILSMVAAGIITAGVADAALAATPALAATAPAGATATGVEAGATAGLGATALPGAMATLPAVGSAAAPAVASTLEGLGWGGSDVAAGGGSSAAAGGGSSAAAAGDGMDLASAWGPGATDLSGTFQGASTISGVNPASSIFSRLASKYGASVVSEAINAYLGQKNLNEQRDTRNQVTALTESNLDPFRGYMAQARDVGKLDMQAEGDFSSSPVQTDPKYGRGLNVQPEQFYTPSTIMRTVARGNRDAVAAGKTVPTMTDPANYGAMPVGDYRAASAPGTAVDPAGSPATALLAALRKKGVVTDDTNPTSPWLAR